jgi:predicted RNA-binding protein
LSDGGNETFINPLDLGLVEPEEEGQIRLVNIFGEQKIIKGKLKSMNLVNHKIIFVD